MPRPPSTLTTTLRSRQRDAADAALNAFALGAARATIVMPCGTGKTHVGVHVTDATAPDGRALVLVPTLQLLNQTARVWYTSGRPGRYLGLCSDESPTESVMADVMTMVGDAATLTRQIRSTIGPVNVFATYAALEKIITSHARHALPRWDLVVVDEAHRTAGALGKAWAAIHDATAIPARHRLYLTATPRIWDVSMPLANEAIASMDDQGLYGRFVYRYSLAQAIADGQLADYRISAPEIHSSELRSYLVGQRDQPDIPGADGMRVASAQLALLRAREEHDIRRTVVFSRSIANSEAFAETLLDTARHLPGHADHLWAASIHSRHTSTERAHRTRHFARPPARPPHGTRFGDLSVLCNVRLAIEGVDFPLADSVLFADPKYSTIDTVQAVGRALRPAPGISKCSTLVIPVFFGPGERPEDATLGTPYHLLYQVMIAMRAYDEHFFHRLIKNGKPTPCHTPLPAPRPERAEEIAPLLGLRTMDPHPDQWLTGLEAAARYQQQQGHLNVDSDYVDDDGFHLGWWIGHQRSLKQVGNLQPERVTALAVYGMRWSHPSTSTEHRLHLARAYAGQNGHLLPEPTDTFRGQPLGAWLAEQRHKHNAGTLPDDYQCTLQGIDPWWNPRWPHEWQRTYARALTAARNDRLAAPVTRAQADANDLTRWLDQQFDLFPTLHLGQRDQLGGLLEGDPLAIGLRRPRSTRERDFAQALRSARRFRRDHHHLDVPADHIDRRHRVHLGWFIACMRNDVARLNREEINALEALGMEWIPGLTAPATAAAVRCA
ncbi:DEAD/DEAH box helicase [Kitasatospora sp. CMC57]|uniref:DEAD/DEAH box helicase n=1 Tax=Kitasatospora sp. CMC57 TaxID=3231513 RepID=A0AB33K9N3_9ACTN